MRGIGRCCNDTDPEEKLKELMQRRAALYAEIADLTVSHGRTPGAAGGGGHSPRAAPDADTITVRIINTVQTLQVELGQSRYPITIGSGLLSDREFLDAQIPGRDLLIVTNTTVAKLYLAKLTGSFAQRRIAECILPDGEQHKTLQTAGWVFDALVANKMNRDATVLALGGGVVGDIAGFAAACYQRGIGYVQIPTTLLAQVDSSVGGKTGVNHPGRQESDRRLLSAARRHRRHRCAGDACRTGNCKSGLAEVIKYGCVWDPLLFEWLDRNMAKLLARDAGGADLCDRPVLRDQGHRGRARRARA